MLWPRARPAVTLLPVLDTVTAGPALTTAGTAAPPVLVLAGTAAWSLCFSCCSAFFFRACCFNSANWWGVSCLLVTTVPVCTRLAVFAPLWLTMIWPAGILALLILAGPVPVLVMMAVLHTAAVFSRSCNSGVSLLVGRGREVVLPGLIELVCCWLMGSGWFAEAEAAAAAGQGEAPRYRQPPPGPAGWAD